MPTEQSQQIIHARRLVTALTIRFPPRTRLPSLPRVTISAWSWNTMCPNCDWDVKCYRKFIRSIRLEAFLHFFLSPFFSLSSWAMLSDSDSQKPFARNTLATVSTLKWRGTFSQRLFVYLLNEPQSSWIENSIAPFREFLGERDFFAAQKGLRYFEATRARRVRLQAALSSTLRYRARSMSRPRSNGTIVSWISRVKRSLKFRISRSWPSVRKYSYGN